MDHPFFDSSSFPWTRADAGALYSILLELMKQPKDIIGIYERSGGDLAWLNRDQPPSDLWTDVLTKLANAQLMRRCCTQLAGFQPLAPNQRFQDTVQAIVDAVPGAELRTPEGVPVLDREKLRGKITQLGQDASALRVLIVRGEAKSGKTYGRHLFHAAAGDQGATKIYLCDGMVMTVEDVVRWLFSALGALDEVPDPGVTTGPAWYRLVCMKLGDLALRKDRRLWIAIDDLGDDPASQAPLMDPEIRVFCNLFGAMMASPAFGERFRLMLIQYPDGPTPTHWQSEVWTEERPCDSPIEAKHVFEFLDAWTQGRGPKQFDHDLVAWAAEVIAEADAVPGPGEVPQARLQRLNDALVHRMRALESASP